MCGSPLAARGDQASSWQYVREQDGITSFRRERAGAPLSDFRARTTIDADIWRVVAILEDVNRGCEWTAHCAQMRKVRRVSEREMLVYARLDAPWPVRDRDVVTRVSTVIHSLTEMVAEIRSVPDSQVPADPDIVRIPSLHASYRFRARADGHVDVEYEIDVDPGGTLPDWLKNVVGRDLAHQTLLKLRERARWATEQGVYAARAAQLREFARVVTADKAAPNSEVVLSKRAP